MNALRDRLRVLVDDVTDRYEALDAERQRQARLVLVLLAIAVPLLLVVTPLAAGRLAAERERASAREQWEAVRDYEATILARNLHKTPAQDVGGAAGDTLLSRVDAAARKADIQGSVQSMRPVASRGKEEAGAVEIQIGGIVYEDFLRFLYQIEVDKPALRVRRVDVQKDTREPNRLKIALEVAP